MSDIDGGLVGGASLKAEEFSKIVKFDEQKQIILQKQKGMEIWKKNQ